MSDDNIMWRMRFVCWMKRTKDTHSDYVILISFPTAIMVTRRHLIVTSYYITCLIFKFVLRVVQCISTTAVPVVSRCNT
jgi:hypothetical protein